MEANRKIMEGGAVGLLIEQNRSLSDKVDGLRGELYEMRHTVPKVDPNDIRELLVRTKKIEDLLHDKESRIRHLEANQNKWFGFKTVIVAIGTVILTLLFRFGAGWVLENRQAIEVKAIPVHDKRNDKFLDKPEVLD